MKGSELEVWIKTSEADDRTKKLFMSIGEHDFDEWLEAVDFSSNLTARLIDKITFGVLSRYYIQKAENPSTRWAAYVGLRFEDKRAEYCFKVIKRTSSPRLMQAACVALADTYVGRTDMIDAALAFYTFAIMLAPKGHNGARAYLGRGNLYMMHAPMFNQGHTKLHLDSDMAKADLEAAFSAAMDVGDQNLMNRAKERLESLTQRFT